MMIKTMIMILMRKMTNDHENMKMEKITIMTMMMMIVSVLRRLMIKMMTVMINDHENIKMEKIKMMMIMMMNQKITMMMFTMIVSAPRRLSSLANLTSWFSVRCLETRSL